MDASRTVNDLDAPGSQPARLQVAGVETPILTQVTRKSARGMTVEQALPFLQLRTQVWDDAQQSSRIESVSVVVYDGVPRLVLDLAYDEQAVEPEAVVAPEPRRAHAGVVRPRLRMDQTESYERPSAAPSPAPRATLPYEAPKREATQTFSVPAKAEQLPLEVSGLKLSVMEQELLQPKDFVYHARAAWQRAKPHMRRAGWQAQAWSMRAYRWSRPRVISLGLAARALAARGVGAALAYVERKRAARALRAEQPRSESASPS